MKIVHVCQCYHPSEGGVQFFFKNISERLVKDYGDDVTVVTTDSWYGPERKIYKKIEPATEVINGVKVKRFSFWRWHISLYNFVFKMLGKLSFKAPDKMKLQASGPFSPAMNRYLINAEADVVCGASASYYYMLLPLWRKVKFFYYGSIHLNEDESKHALYDLQLSSIKSAAKYLANTAYEKYRLEKMGVDGKKIFILGTGVDMQEFTVEKDTVKSFRANMDIPDSSILIGYVGRIEKTKNILQLIKSFDQLVRENADVYLLIAGSANTYSGELQEYCKKLPTGIWQRIKWKENFDMAEKSAIFNALDIFVLSSFNESFGIVFLEAWSCKKPVIGASIGAVRDVINNEVDGLVFEVSNVQSLTDQLLRLINSPELRQKLGENGFNKVKDNFTWDIIVSRLRQCYVDALSA